MIFEFRDRRKKAEVRNPRNVKVYYRFPDFRVPQRKAEAERPRNFKVDYHFILFPSSTAEGKKWKSKKPEKVKLFIVFLIFEFQRGR